MNILYLGSHGILEYDQVKLWTELGYDVFSIGSYSDPANPSEGLRPAIVGAPSHPELLSACHRRRAERGDPGAVIDWAKADLPDEVIDWADTVIVDCFPDIWITSNWQKIRTKRVIWRTIGQSSAMTEGAMRALRGDGLQIVRYSPAEERGYRPVYAGHDAIIRFGKDPADWYGWTGEVEAVANITQNMVGRGPFCNLDFYHLATDRLDARPAGPESEKLPGGIGALDYDEMRAYLRRMRVYLYTGTQPASYTLGFIEAMMTGIPVASIGPSQMWNPGLFEAHELVAYSDELPMASQCTLRHLLANPGGGERERAIELFGTETIGRQWQAFLG